MEHLNWFAIMITRFSIVLPLFGSFVQFSNATCTFEIATTKWYENRASGEYEDEATCKQSNGHNIIDSVCEKIDSIRFASAFNSFVFMLIFDANVDIINSIQFNSQNAVHIAHNGLNGGWRMYQHFYFNFQFNWIIYSKNHLLRVLSELKLYQ